MRQETHPHTANPANRAMATTLRILEGGRTWIHGDLHVLRRLADGLLGLRWPGRHCEFTDPLRGLAHAHYVMDLHRGHGCPRYDMAAAYTETVTS